MVSPVDYWRRKELRLAKLTKDASKILEEMIDAAVEGDDIAYWVNLKGTLDSAQKVFNPPGEPRRKPYKNNVISFDRYKGMKS